MTNRVVILGAVRTPFGGTLSSLSAPKLSGAAIEKTTSHNVAFV